MKRGLRIISGALPVIGFAFAVGFLGATPAKAMTVVSVDETLGIARGVSASHDHLINPGTNHGSAASPQLEAAHFTWVLATPPAVLTTVEFFIHNHGGTNALSADQITRIQDSAGVWNASGAMVSLAEVAMDALADIHVHGDSASGCGAGSIGCAEISWFLAHNPAGYADGHPQHRMVSNTTSALAQELTMLTRSDWYAGAAPGGILGTQLDYMSVAIQEFGHHLGLEHNGNASHGHLADEALSPMNGSLPSGITRRVLQPSDTAAIVHLYGAVPEPGTLVLLAAGALGIALIRRRDRRR